MQLRDYRDLDRSMRTQRIGVRRLAAAVGRGKSTIDRLRSGQQRTTDPLVAAAIERELGLAAGSLFVVPDVPRVPCKCNCHGAAA